MVDIIKIDTQDLCLRRVYAHGNRALGFPKKMIGICGKKKGHAEACLIEEKDGRAVVVKAPYYV